MDVVICVDTLVADVHFDAAVRLQDVGYKAMAVNLSDVAAMGAQPHWAGISATVPDSNADALREICAGARELADRYGVQLVTGTVAVGALAVSVEVIGSVPEAAALRRDAARAGEWLCVTGSLGDAALGLRVRRAPQLVAPDVMDVLLQRLDRPEPRLAAGQRLRGRVRCAIDVSDGLVADLGHILEASGVGARLCVRDLPLSDTVRDFVAATGAWELPLAGGDDYELCFTLAQEHFGEVSTALAEIGLPCTPIGVVEAQPGLRVEWPEGVRGDIAAGGYDHFGPRASDRTPP